MPRTLVTRKLPSKVITKLEESCDVDLYVGDKAISRDELLLRVWQLNPRGLATRTIDMHVMRLREKLRDDPAQPSTVVTVRGKGYMLANAE